MTDYNDGNWHGWDGGECPVHHESEIDAVWPSVMDDEKSYRDARKAKDFPWIVGGAWVPFLFRVTKPYVEPPKPREFWIVETDGTTLTFQNEGLAKEYARDFGFYVIHVREVIEE